ncbi:LysR family transcriptional regulator [Phyllobacterium salinisoli]|uniref:LysR family transcriptional regulator n=1 Tax=Phyllobacterium salinisoli TaxID=1899321 RepID=A0A368K9I5_9HYPH|nr:LysR family transcriptional regulator [Phyllobacterium salinisoli]RCS25143.1 LysR family transcriptional regulator [Phyllobacterium salinisoli]
MNRNQLSQLAVLASVAAHGSFRAAARELEIAPSAVSHAVATLEEGLGVALLARTTRSVAPTEAGRRLLERLSPALAEIELALGAAVDMRDTVAGTLRLSVPRAAAHLVLAPRFGEFCAAYPDVTLDICIEDHLIDIVAHGYDAGMRLNENLEADMVAVRCGPPICGAVVAAPSYFERYGIPMHPADLIHHRCIRHRFPSGRVYRWELEKGEEILEMAVDGRMILNDDRLALEAALQGVGIAFLFDLHVMDAVADGRLVRVLEDWCPAFPGLYIYYPSRRRMRPALRAFIDFYKF